MKRSFALLAPLALVLVAVAFEVPASAYEIAEVKNGGTITGRVYFEKDYPKPERKKVTRDNNVCGIRMTSEEFVVDPKSKGLANAVLVLEGIEKGKAFPKDDKTLDQLKCRYSPHVMVKQTKTTLVVVNKDPILHNIHAYLGDRTLFNLAQPIQNQVTKKKLRRKGVVRVGCDVHDWMESYVLIVDNPYYGITDRQGNFKITDVPPGDYTLKMWQEVLGESTKKVAVKAGKSAKVDFLIGE